jgi:peptide deformylase
MSIKPVVKMGNKQLATPSLPVEDFATPELFELIKDMQDTMKEKSSVGIAAPKIGYKKRVIMFGFEKSERYPNKKPMPFTALINPVIEILYVCAIAKDLINVV